MRTQHIMKATVGDIFVFIGIFLPKIQWGAISSPPLSKRHTHGTLMESNEKALWAANNRSLINNSLNA